jgi:hypothetical protein
MGLSDLHVHTIYSHDGIETIPAILERAAGIGLHAIAITDHDAMGGVPEALELASTYGVSVVPGCEVSTLDGHLVALFVRRPIAPWLTLAETLKRAADQGGLCIASHPGGNYDYSLDLGLVRRTLQDPELARILVGIESFNAGLLHPDDNLGAGALARDLRVARLGGSDAHVLRAIGTGLTWFPGTSADDLREALENHTTEAVPGRARTGPLILAEWGARLAWRHARQLTGAPYPENRFVGRHPGRNLSWSEPGREVTASPVQSEGDVRSRVGED